MALKAHLLPTAKQLIKKTSQAVATTQTQSKPGPAGNGKLYLDIPGRSCIIFNFRPNPNMDDQHQPWFGRMDVKCDDVPLLMREGFYWSSANVVKEEGFIEPIRSYSADLGKPNNTCSLTMVWILQDLQQPPRWTAYLQVHANQYKILSEIQLDDWTVDMIRDAQAWDLSEKTIYQFKALAPWSNISIIYDNIPLKGWWPWPKEDPTATKKA